MGASTLGLGGQGELSRAGSLQLAWTRHPGVPQAEWFKVRGRFSAARAFGWRKEGKGPLPPGTRLPRYPPGGGDLGKPWGIQAEPWSG